jgi:hypothetical protein
MPRTILLTAVASKREYRNLIPEVSIQILQKVLEWGEKQSKSGWRKVPARVHLQRAQKHIDLWLAGDRTERHLRHAFCRLMMAVVLIENPVNLVDIFEDENERS